MQFIIKINLIILFYTFFSTNLFSKDLERVSLQLSWFSQFQFAGYYIAKEKGFYEDVGLDVNIKKFNFGVDVPNEVNIGKSNFGVGRETLLLDKSNGKHIVALYALFQASPLILLSLKDSNINKIKDFENKRIMTTRDDASEVSIKAMITSKNVDYSKMTFLKHTHNIMDLVNKKTDIISAYISKSPYLLNKMKIKYNIFYPKDYGFDMYSDFLFTNSKEIKNHEQRVIDFKNASLKGWQYAFSHIQETAKLIYNKYNEQHLTLEQLIFEAKKLKKLAYYNNETLGNIKLDKVQRIYDLYNVMGLTKKQINVSSFIYNNKYNLFTKGEKSYIKNRKEINICLNPNISLANNNGGKISLIFNDLIKLLEKNSGLDFNIINSTSYDKSFEKFKNKRCDILPTIYKSKLLKKEALFTDDYVNVPLVIATKENVAFISNINSLKNKKIGIVGDKHFVSFIKKYYPRLNIEKTKNLKEGLDKVVKNKLYAQIDTITRMSEEIQSNYLTKLKISGKLNKNLPLYFAIDKSDNFLLNILNKSIRYINDYDKQQILNKWISVLYKKSFDYSLIMKILLFFIIVFSIIMYRQRLLNKVNSVLKEKVDEKTKELTKLNESLEKRIKIEVENSREKDKLISQQVKMVAMGEMIENIAHQWRQPLSIISTTASGIELKKNADILTDEELLESMESINETAQHLSKTIEDFRNFYEPNKSIVEFNIIELYSKTYNIIKYKFESLKIKIIKNIENKYAIGLDSELVQVIINILNNAKDALELNDNLKEKLIFINIYMRNDYLNIIIKDNAGGIDENIIDRVFEPYFTTKHKSQGTGIGLYMTQDIVSKHMNGKLIVKNRRYLYNGIVYKGAQFKIKIPQMKK
ncbi:ABC transporter substrate-binding protein [Arcobacter sp. CECT 8985]|uniref:ABC transporter substrate-binding protein n=1 Tax=Arcobacter sp. CECT 8985 TaxID=1935424 RepID=UPI00100AFF22|nr:ABC transporter substrate-binding protein [Arcobacter sp. CECT 8985]RXJ83905.1 histidine kinase [Arcobacter sp. CECT 8985]